MPDFDPDRRGGNPGGAPMSVPKFDMKRIAVTRLKPAPYQPRKTFSQQADLELGLDMQRHGQKTPLRVYPDGDDFTIIAGNRRFNGAKLVGIKELDCKIEEPISPSDLVVDQIIDNEAHQSLPAFDLMDSCYQLMRVEGWSQSALAAKLGWSESKLCKLIAIKSSADQEVQDLLRQGKLGTSLVYQLARCPAEFQLKIARMVASGEVSEVIAKGMLDREKQAKKPTAVRLTLELTTFEGVKAKLAELLAQVGKVERLGAGIGALKGLLR